MPSERKYRVAVAGGAGAWGRRYLRAFANHPDCEIVGLADPRWSWLFVPFWMIVLWHYWVEGRIWKMRRQPELRAVLSRG